MSPKGRRDRSLQASASHTDQRSKKRKRGDATVYDAVAGRCSTQRFIPPKPYTSRTRDVPTSSTLPIPPEEVLFRRLGAPERDIHDDFYWADRHLGGKQILPDSDLLKAVHAYAADFYHAMGGRGGVSFCSMDETALLAVGILLEEAAEEVLGEKGDMVFVEGEELEKPQERKSMQTEAMEIEVSEEGQQGQFAEGRLAAQRRKGKKKAKKSKTVRDHGDPGQDLA